MLSTRRTSTDAFDRGFTLVELVVAMFLLGILGVMVTTSIRVVARTSIGVTERVDAQQQARVALGALTRDIRLAVPPPGANTPPIRVATAESVTFTSNVDRIEMPELIQVTRVVGGLQETQVDARLDNVDGDDVVVYDATPSQRLVAQDVIDGGLPIFTYYDDASVDLAGSDGSVAAADLGRIALVRVSVTIKPNPASSARATTLTSTVRLINRQA